MGKQETNLSKTPTIPKQDFFHRTSRNYFYVYKGEHIRLGRVLSITQSSQRSQIHGCELYENIIYYYFVTIDDENAFIVKWQLVVEDYFLVVLAIVPE
jgi:hypothetical protein